MQTQSKEDEQKTVFDEMKKERERSQLALRKKRRNELLMEKRLLKEEFTGKEKFRLKYEITEDALRELNSSIRNLQFETLEVLIKEMKKLLISDNIIENKYAVLVIRKYSLVDKHSLIALFNEGIDELLLQLVLSNLKEPSITYEVLWIMINYSFHSKDCTKLITLPLSMSVWEKIIGCKDYELTAHVLWLFSNCCENNTELCYSIAKSHLFLHELLPLFESNCTFGCVIVKGLSLIALLTRKDNDEALQYRLISIVINNYINCKGKVRQVCIFALAYASFIPEKLVIIILDEIAQDATQLFTFQIIEAILISSQLKDCMLIDRIISFLCKSMTVPLHLYNNKVKEALRVLSNYFQGDTVYAIKKVQKEGVFNRIIEIAKDEGTSLSKEAVFCLFNAMSCKDNEVVLLIAQSDLCDLSISLLNRNESDNEFIELILDFVHLLIQLGDISNNKGDNYYARTLENKGCANLLPKYSNAETVIIAQKASYLLSTYFCNKP